MANYDMILTIGHNVHGIPSLTDTDIIKALRYIGISGATFIPCTGIWGGEREESTRVEICGVSAEETARIKQAIPDVCKRLQQDCIMFDSRVSSTEFIGQT